MKPLRLLPLLVLACTITEPTERNSVPQTTGQESPPRFGARLNTGQNPSIVLIAGDIAWCGIGDDEKTAALLDSLVGVHPDAIVVPNGDLVYPDGSAANFANCYGPSWGRHKTRSRPVLGNHEYDASSTAQFYFDYFNGVASDGPAGPRDKGYYEYSPHSSWQVVVLNTNSAYVGTKAGTPQGSWLAASLAANTKACILALFHHPRFASQSTAPLSGYTLYPWEQLYAAGADLTVNASHHAFERFAPQRPDGTADPEGIREFIVGTGGASGAPTPTVFRANSEAWANTRGVLKLELGEGYYRWEFVWTPGRTFVDTGEASCHGVTEPPDSEPPPPPPPSSIVLTVSGSSDATKNYMALDWTGATGTNVDVYRNGPLLTTTLNDGHYVNGRVIQPGGVTYVYKVCQTGSAVCSNEASVTFN